MVRFSKYISPNIYAAPRVATICVISGLLLTLLVACRNNENSSPVPPVTPTISIPSTPTPGAANAYPAGTPFPTAPPAENDLLPIDEILSEIDNDVCQNAYETKAELEALIAEGVDLGELETAVNELITELENCPTPQGNN